MIASFKIGPFFFKEQPTAGPAACSVTSAHLESMLQCFAIAELKQCGILDATIFMQDRIHWYMCHTVILTTTNK